MQELKEEYFQFYPQQEHDPLQDGEQDFALPREPRELKVENFFFNRFDPQCGQAVPFISCDLTRISLSFLHFSQ